MLKRKCVILAAAEQAVSESSCYENSYCGYCCKLIELKTQSSASNDVELGDSNYEYIILCANCRGPFHIGCTAFAATPIDKIREQCLKWKCNTCVKNEVPNVGKSADSSPEDDRDVTRIDFAAVDRDELIQKRLSAMLCVYGKDLQNVCGKIEEAKGNSSYEGSSLVIDAIPAEAKEAFFEEILRVAAGKGIKLTRSEAIPAISGEKISFVIRLDPHATRQLLLNSYLNSIMHPITASSTKPASFYLANDRDIEVSSSTCLLPQHNNQHHPNAKHRSIYMYEYLAANASSSAENQTMLVKAIAGNGNIVNGGAIGIAGDSDNDSVFHADETTRVLVPIIKISTVPKRVRLASKENFDDIEDNNNNNLPPIQSSSSIVSIVSTASVAGSEPSDGVSESQIIPKSKEEKIIPYEPWWHTTLQISIPFFLAGIGTVGAGIILGFVEHWDVFKHISELFILIPSLLGLKGNLDMCLASRMSTQANLGNMVSKKVILKMILGNIALVQIQATVAAFIVSLFAIGVGQTMNGNYNFNHACVVTAAAMFTATASCFVLDFFLIAMVLLSMKFKMNPDNLATPLAASIGDIVSISVFSFIASFLYRHHETHLWATFVVVGVYFILLPCWIIIVLRNEYTSNVLKSGWVPVLSALFISGLGGLVLDSTIGKFTGFVVFQPIINGIGGNLVSVQASKISTMLHQSSILGIVPPYTKIVESPFRALIKGVPYAKTARILLLMTIPALVFIFVADVIHTKQITIGIVFTVIYWLVSLLQVSLLLYTAHIIIHWMWRHKIDPDNSAIPYLTAMGDLSGTCFLFVAFMFLTEIGYGYNVPE